MDRKSLLGYREGNRLEFKDARGGLPRSFWETYSAFANTNGGVIVLGVAEGADGRPRPSGVVNPDALVQDLWNALNNPQRVSANLLLDGDVSIEELDGSSIVIVHVPRADRTLRPVYINNNPNTGTYRRNGEGDYRCTPETVRSLMRDSAEGATDRLVLPELGLDAFCMDTVQRYRNALRAERPDHPWRDLDDEELLVRLGAAGRSREDGRLHPTRAGLLMFGHAWRIVEEFPQYFLDCRQEFSHRRWDNRVTSASGEWSGNVFDFWYKAYPMLSEGLPVPFELGPGMTRIDDTPQHKAVREALTNMLVHADYYGRTGLVALRTSKGIELTNPGTLRLPLDVIEGGGVSDPRNLTMLTMFNLIGMGDKAGSGFDALRRSAEWAGVGAPTLTESLDPDRVMLALPLATGGLSLAMNGKRATDERRPAETGEAAAETGEEPIATGEDRRSLDGRPAKTGEDGTTNRRKEPHESAQEYVVVSYLGEHGTATPAELSEVLGLGASRTREILSRMVAKGLLQRLGKTSSTRYELTSKG